MRLRQNFFDAFAWLAAWIKYRHVLFTNQGGCRCNEVEEDEEDEEGKPVEKRVKAFKAAMGQWQQRISIVRRGGRRGTRRTQVEDEDADGEEDDEGKPVKDYGGEWRYHWILMEGPLSCNRDCAVNSRPHCGEG